MQAVLGSLSPGEAATLGHLAATKPAKMQRVLQAIASDIDTMDTVASDISPTREPVLDYITEIDVRSELFTKFRDMTNSFDLSSWKDYANATMLAMFMVAPVHELQNFISNCETTSGTGHILEIEVNHCAPLAIRACTHNLSISFSYPD